MPTAKTVVQRTYDPAKQECRVVMGYSPYEVHRSFGLDEVMNLSQTDLDSVWNRVYTEMGEEWEAKVKHVS